MLPNIDSAWGSFIDNLHVEPQMQRRGIGQKLMQQAGTWLASRFATEPIYLLVWERYEKWKDIVAISGPQGLRLIRGFNDEALSGEWKGHRSSRLNQQYRVIYRVERDLIRVDVVDVTAHDYRRK